mmetsp:Transcript_488/g.807  ORF Transcript_488/g.807 Transcript_488/m.807 type:complete len:85 (-) Transcript_488:705-959(-)
MMMFVSFCSSSPSSIFLRLRIRYYSTSLLRRLVDSIMENARLSFNRIELIEIEIVLVHEFLYLKRNNLEWIDLSYDVCKKGPCK